MDIINDCDYRLYYRRPNKIEEDGLKGNEKIGDDFEVFGIKLQKMFGTKAKTLYGEVVYSAKGNYGGMYIEDKVTWTNCSSVEDAVRRVLGIEGKRVSN